MVTHTIEQKNDGYRTFFDRNFSFFNIKSVLIIKIEKDLLVLFSGALNTIKRIP